MTDSRTNRADAETTSKLFKLTISLLLFNSCITDNKTIDNVVLKDGWYNIGLDGKAIKRELIPGDTVLLFHKPSISFKDITSIESELLYIYADTSLQINFNLTENGKKEWNNIIQNPKSTEIYFVLDDTIINLLTVFTDPEHKKASHFHLTLGYSDFTATEIRRIEDKIKERLPTIGSLNPSR